MNSYFNTNIEFDHSVFYNAINQCIIKKRKGYVCVIDANVLTLAQKSPGYLEIINKALVNTCDGSSIAWLAGLVHRERFTALNGPEIFSSLIEKEYKQLLVGSTVTVKTKIKEKLLKKGKNDKHLFYMPLPFLGVDEFDYQVIANEINELQPEIIWVSLGAPKQEIFMSKLLPHLNSGIMFGIGAAFNFYIGEISQPKTSFGALRFIWLSRIIHEPKKQLMRILPYLLLLPKLYWKERKAVKHSRIKSESI